MDVVVLLDRDRAEIDSSSLTKVAVLVEEDSVADKVEGEVGDCVSNEVSWYFRVPCSLPLLPFLPFLPLLALFAWLPWVVVPLERNEGCRDVSPVAVWTEAGEVLGSIMGFACISGPVFQEKNAMHRVSRLSVMGGSGRMRFCSMSKVGELRKGTWANKF